MSCISEKQLVIRTSPICIHYRNTVFHKGRCCGNPAKRRPFVTYKREVACMGKTACYTHETLVQTAFLTSVSTIYFTGFNP